MNVDESGGGQSATPSAEPRNRPLIIRHFGLRQASEQDIVDAVGGLTNLGRLPVIEMVDTSAFTREADGAAWDESHGYVWRRALELRARLQTDTDTRVIYAGMPEVPHALAFGAYFGDE